MDDTYVQQAILLQIFPEFRRQSKEDRELQLKVINEKFDVVDWYQGEGNDSEPTPDHMRQYPFEFYDWHNRSWFVVRFSGIKLRARLIHKVPDIYCAIIQSSTVPQILFYNEMIPLDRWQNDETCDGERFEHAWHPHISGSEPCTGAHSRHFSRTASDGSIIGFLAAIRNFLGSWNNRSRFWNLNSYRPFTGNYARKVLITAWDMSYIRNNVGIHNSNDMSTSMEFQYQTIPRLYTHLVHEQGAFPKEACMITRLLSRSLGSADYRKISEKLVTGTQYHADYVVLNEWYERGWKHRNERFNDKDSNTMSNVYYNYQDFLWEKFPAHINRESNNQMVIDNDDLGDFALMAYAIWMENGGSRHYKSGKMDICLIEKTFREFFGMNVEFHFDDIYETIDPKALYGDLFGHELVMKLIRAAKIECCLTAYKRFGKRQKEIENEINTLQDNSTENRVFQQILRF